MTAYRALFPRGLLKAGEKVLITGIGGGVATLALQFAIAAGAQVYITSGSPEKIRKAKSLGAIQGFSYLENQWALSAKAVAGSFDLIVDGAGGDGVNHLLDLVKPGGRVLFYGATKGNATQIEIRRIFWKQINVMGSTMGSEKDFVEMLSFVNSHGIKPIIDQIYPLSEGESAFRKMDEGIQFGKIILKMS